MYAKKGGKWEVEHVLQEVSPLSLTLSPASTGDLSLSQHGQRVTGMDWAPKSDRLVTCGAVSSLSLSLSLLAKLE